MHGADDGDGGSGRPRPCLVLPFVLHVDTDTLDAQPASSGEIRNLVPTDQCVSVCPSARVCLCAPCTEGRCVCAVCVPCVCCVCAVCVGGWVSARGGMSAPAAEPEESSGLEVGQSPAELQASSLKPQVSLTGLG